MGKLFKYSIALVTALLAAFLYLMNEECFYTDRDKFALFHTYLQRASDPNEKRLRLVETKKVVSNAAQGRLVLTTLKFVDEKHYMNAFSKTYKLSVTREAGLDNRDHEWINASLYLDIDYGVRTEHEIIFLLSRVGKNDTHWTALSSLYENPVGRVRKKISAFPDTL